LSALFKTPVLEPVICKESGQILDLADFASLNPKVLHNEIPLLSDYPLQLADQHFFSEVLSHRNTSASVYFDWIVGSLNLIRGAISDGHCMHFENILQVGKNIQLLDAKIINLIMNGTIDDIHLCFGSDLEHPYRKITLCRVGFPVWLGNAVINFMFEKFLVIYSYRDKNGKRQSTRTPIHSHPLNHEVTYFLSGGTGSTVIEEEFTVVDEDGAALILKNGSFNPKIKAQLDKAQPPAICVRHAATHNRAFSGVPMILDEFESDRLLACSEKIILSDGFFRPHRVTVIDDTHSKNETLYYAINNYWTPTGRVYVYGDNTVKTWNHADWQGDLNRTSII
jgi:hypothetical protein